MSAFTKKAITESFIKLLNEKPLDKITVKDIVEDCGINRNTFYYYYQDIYALLDELFLAETDRTLLDATDYSTLQQTLLAATAFVRENRRAIYHIYKSISRERLEQYLYDVSDQLLLRMVHSLTQGLEVSEGDIRLVSDFYKYALVGMVLDWLNGNMQKDADEAIRRLGVLLEGNIRSTLEKVAPAHEASGEKESDIPAVLPH